MNQHASMNRIFRLVWSEAVNAYVAAAETARGRGKRGKRKLIGAALLLLGAVAHAGGPTGGPSGGPTGGRVTGGSGTITQSGGTTTIQQASEDLSLNWQNFNIGSQQTVDFVQPNAAAIAVNRVLGSTGSVILGHLDANGQVYLINPNGVLFGKGAEVNVGGLVASTLNLNDSTLGDDSTSFSGAGSGSVVNDGSLTAKAGAGTGGGAIVLLGDRVSNGGVISAQLGSVALGAGSATTLRFSGTHLVSMQVDQSVLNSVASNGGLIRADGGQVLMTAGAQKALVASVVNNTGIIEARTLDKHAGTITLLGGMSAGTVLVAGTLDASAPNGGNGGSIDTSAAQVQVEAAAKITTAANMTTAASLGLNGSWRIDPTDFTIAAGSAAQSASGIGATTLQGALAHGNVSIATSASGSEAGDIDVNAPVSWSANALTLTAANDINVNAVMSVSGTARVDFEPGSGNLVMGFAPDGSFAGRVDISSTAANALTIGGQVYTVINSLGAPGSTTGTDLQGMNGNLAGHFALGSNIDASATAAWNPCNSCVNGGSSGNYGFTPIGGSVTTPFTGSFDGLGHTISNLTSNSDYAVNIGLFGWIGATGIARNIGFVGASVYANANAGALAGSNYGRISNSYSVTGGIIAGGSSAGGLVGFNGTSGLISNSYTTGSVDSEQSGGGVVGQNYGTVTNSHSSATMSGGDSTGGLVGSNYGTISRSYATGNVQGGYGVSLGGLVGNNTGTGSITNSYATGTVAGSTENNVGGLVGTNAGAISASDAIGAVSASGGYAKSNTGGLVGSNSGAISASFATGAVSGSGPAQLNTGGLAGYNNASISTSYATGAVTGYNNVGGLVGSNDSPGTIATSNASGTVSAANANAGGLVGSNYGPVTTSHATGTVSSGGGGAGGLVGTNGGQGPGGPITDSYATGDVSAVEEAGGLVGYNNGAISATFATGNVSAPGGTAGGLVGYNEASVTQSYATGAVSGSSYVGGLVGQNAGPISIAFASGAVTGTMDVGGLVGNANGSSTITNSYASGSVSGSMNVGGLVGFNYGLVDRSYASGMVTGSGYAASLVGQSSGTITNSFYDVSSNPGLPGFFNNVGPGYNAPGTLAPLTTAQLQTQANYTSATSANAGVNPDWDFGATWVMYEGHTAPLLQYFMTPLTVTGTFTQTYNGAGFAPSISHLTYSFAPDDSHLLGTVTAVGGAAAALNVGTYSFTPGGLYSDQLGYIISYNAGTLTITPATLTVSGTTAGNKIYDGTTVATLSGGSLVGLLGGDTLTLTQAGSFASKNAGTGIAVTASDSIGGANADDYLLVDPTGLTANITPAPLTVSGTTVGNKIYDGTTLALLSGGSLVGLIGGDTVVLNQSGMFTSPDVGSGITVIATDSLSGASAGDYSIVEPTGLTASIRPAAGTAATGGGLSDLELAAVNARTQIVENFIYPQLGANPQVINASSTISSAGETGSQQAVVINVSMNIGANGTLKIEDGGVRLPGNSPSAQ